ncbi:hypothetical protein BpHYR1_042326 [Brachionus plicatilis]|uniref:Uncharacterized protein n=1 Tax=Brachionus plicatilis TaxID=10195 RepID=A0A3M7SUE6_BRAPC|nr:hypothetical protein BpHYR1_042326 [Brachionus plicatilis]
MLIELESVPSVPKFSCAQNVISNCKIENYNRSISICNCVNRKVCPCYLANFEFLTKRRIEFQNSSFDKFGIDKSNESGSVPLHLIFSCLIIFILILIVVFGMVCTCFCSPKRRCCFKRACSEIANLDQQAVNSNSSYETSYPENEPPPMYTQEMLKDSQKSERLPDYKSLFEVKFQQQQQEQHQAFQI